jgi:hypothetical protein
MTKPIKIGMWKGEKCNYAHAKIDGNWLTITADGRAYSSLPTDVTEKCMDYGWFDAACEAGVELWGEVWVPGRPASDVRSWPSSARFTVFAVPHLGVECPLQDVDVWCVDHGLEFAPFLTLRSGEWNRKELLAHAKAAQLEGWVMKHYHLAYWYKLKIEDTVDVKVVGFKPGKGKYLGLVGSLICADATGREVADVGGFTDTERANIDIVRDLGRTVEVKYQYVGSQGKLRHPRFVRWRDDKDTADTVPLPSASADTETKGDESYAPDSDY